MQQIKKRAIDNDDVLFPLIPYFCCQFHNEKYGTKTRMEDFKTFDIVSLWGITEEEWWDREREFYASHLYLQMEPLPGAYDALEYFSKTGESYLVTGRGKDVEHHTKSKLNTHFAPHHFKGVYHTGGHIFNGERQSKHEICTEIGATILFDDLHTTLIKAAQHGINGILFTQPWNKSITDLPKNVFRVENWNQAIDTVEKYNL